MSYCKKFTVTQSAFVLVADGVSDVFVQLKDGGPVLVRVAASLPAASNEDAVMLDAAGLMEVQLQGLEVTDKVYVRCIHDETNEVIVVAPGSAPA